MQFGKKPTWLFGRFKTDEKIESHPPANLIYPGVSSLRFILILLIVCNDFGLGQVADGGFEKMGLKIWFKFTSPTLAMLSGRLFFKNINDDKYFSKTIFFHYSHTLHLVVSYLYFYSLYSKEDICIFNQLRSLD